MRTSQFLLSTTKETPTDAEIISHQLMLRAGLVRKLAAGLYTWLPTGVRVLQKVEAIVRDEMNRAGALETLMPVVQPAELWQESERFDQYGPELLRFVDRHNRDFVLGPTHEEVITDIARREIKSYKQLPLNLYQIQTKFRDEIRPRFGIMRSREFVMKDAYSFHLDQASLEQTYQTMHQAYCAIFARCGLDYRPVAADTGSIGGSGSHEFHVLADSGEDAIAFSDKSDYAANVELAEAVAPKKTATPNAKMATVDTPGAHTIEAVANFFSVSPKQTVKTLLVEDAQEKIFALVLRGDHTLNEIKLSKLPHITAPFQFASDAHIKQHTGADAGSIGPVGLDIPVLVDHSAAALADFICGANENDKHFTGVNWGRDLPQPESVDIRNVVKGDPSPDGQGKLKIARGVEVGHIFQLGSKYSEALKAEVLNEQGKNQAMVMGCYGIGVTRVIAATIEQNHDDKGIIWPDALAPFQVAIAPINIHKSDAVKQAAEQLYQELQALDIEVLFDDRGERPGVMFADMELIGIPHRITIGDRSLEKGMVEYKHRRAKDSEEIALTEIITSLKTKLVN